MKPLCRVKPESAEQIADNYAKRTGRTIVARHPRNEGRHLDIVLSDGEYSRVKYSEKPFFKFAEECGIEYETTPSPPGASFNKEQVAESANRGLDYVITGYKANRIFRMPPSDFVDWALENETEREFGGEETLSVPLPQMEEIE